jgi:hypothetical protein
MLATAAVVGMCRRSPRPADLSPADGLLLGDSEFDISRARQALDWTPGGTGQDRRTFEDYRHRRARKVNR